MAAAASHVLAQLDAVLARDPAVRAVAVRVDARQDLPATLTARGRPFDVHWCETWLAVRDALCRLDADPAPALLLLTPLSDHQLPADVAARLGKARIFQPRDWEIVRPMFGATAVDSRLGRHDWIAQQLIELAHLGPYPSLASRFLDLDTAWREFFARALHLDSARPDGASLLQWSSSADSQVRWHRLPDRVQADVKQWLEHECGPAGVLVAACLQADRLGDALPLALAAGVVFSVRGAGHAGLAQAAVRLERYLGERHVGAQEGRAWALEAQRLLQQSAETQFQAALERADALLQELKIGASADLADWSPAGFEQRMGAFADALSDHLTTCSDTSCALVEDAANAVLAHRQAAIRRPRSERVSMARRLARWLLMAAPARAGVAELLAWQSDEGAFVDWARFKLLGGDESQHLSDAYGKLRDAVAKARSARNREFAGHLRRSQAEDMSAQGRIVPLESVLERVIAPLAANRPVLLLVVDGLSLSIFRQLFEQPEQHGWSEQVRDDLMQPLVGLAVFPTVTESSRASLLCGQLCIGAAPQEKVAFARHPALAPHTSAKHPPELFHKGDLVEDGNLSPRVRSAIADSNRKVIGVVFNAIDDHLNGPEQLHQRWSLEDLRLLLPLLREAREARRTLVVTADHGHVLEHGSRQVRGDESDRWRKPRGELVEGELALSNQRVVSPDGSRSVVCLVDEDLRYTGRKNGYHGGASLQEVAVPLSVFTPTHLELPGWTLAPPQQPEWWDLPRMAVSSGAAPARPRTPRRAPKASDVQTSLFEVPAPATPAAQAEDWIEALLGHATYAAQRQMAARVALPDAQMRQLLLALDERGGKAGWSLLAKRLGCTELRLPGMLSAARRVLNVDQSAVLVVDEASRTIELNRALLEQQFKLATRGGTA